jgi:hypothetical protein
LPKQRLGSAIGVAMLAFRKGTAQRKFSPMLTFLKEAAAKIANPPPWPEFSPEVRDIASISDRHG